jgi:hypothetical protein
MRGDIHAKACNGRHNPNPLRSIPADLKLDITEGDGFD